MQTFLPYQDFSQSAQVLDMRRLGKQRVEAYQIAKVLLDPSAKAGWRNHPAVKMWRGHEGALVLYTKAICTEWKRRGYKDTVEGKIEDLARQFNVIATDPPSWLGDEELHQSHRSNLIRKLPEHYQTFWPTVTPELPYVWPR